MLLAVTSSLAPAARTDSAALNPTWPGQEPPNPFASLQARPKYVVLLVLDGGLPTYFRLGDFPHLKALQRDGTTYTSAWDGMLETETPTGHATLGTGSLPRRHGVISFSWVTDQAVHEQPTNPIPIQQGALEQVLRQSGVPSLSSLLKAHDPSARVVVTSGHKDYAVDAVGGPYADYLMYYALQGQQWMPVAIPRHVPPRSVLDQPSLKAFAPHLGPGDQDSFAVQLAMSAFRTIHQRVTIINEPEFDWPLGHLDGGGYNRNLAWRLMTRLDSDVANIEAQLQAAHVLKQTLFVLTADHGMLTLRHRIAHDVIEKVVHDSGTTLSDYEYHSAGYLWLNDRNKVEQVAANMVKLNNPYIRAVYLRLPGSIGYTRQYDPHNVLPEGAELAYQFLLSTLAGPSAPHIAIMLRENTAIVGRNEINWLGDHGGGTWNAEHIPLMLSGPGVRRGFRSDYPATIYDISPTILSLLGAASTGMDGVPLADSILSPAPSEQDAQSVQRGKFTPLVQALKAESKKDR